jgi:hypothetical protein
VARHLWLQESCRLHNLHGKGQNINSRLDSGGDIALNYSGACLEREKKRQCGSIKYPSNASILSLYGAYGINEGAVGGLSINDPFDASHLPTRIGVDGVGNNEDVAVEHYRGSRGAAVRGRSGSGVQGRSIDYG